MHVDSKFTPKQPSILFLFQNRGPTERDEDNPSTPLGLAVAMTTTYAIAQVVSSTEHKQQNMYKNAQ
jgi:hypothetical protein